MNRVGIVVIGRNEGERLRSCLAAVCAGGESIVYVDSGSTDGSVELARAMGATVVELDLSTPFTAARARNAGFHRLLSIAPDTEFVQFIDGDCELRPGWLATAAESLCADAELAAVCGRVRERYPDRSIYTRLCDLEWNAPPGDIDSTGGIAMMRVAAFSAAGGFDPSVPAGEEPELCARLRRGGWRIRRLDFEMTWHDAAMVRFGQWWKRQIRTGYGALDVAERFGDKDSSLYGPIIRSARLWTVGWVIAVIAGGAIGMAMGGWRGGLLLGGLVVLVWPAQALRIGLRIWRRGAGAGTALGYGVLTMVSKWAQLLGQLRYRRERQRGGKARLIEYKTPGDRRKTRAGVVRDPDFQADLRRYPPRPFLREQSIWAVWIYRFGRRNDRRPPGLRRRVGDRFYWLTYRVIETLTGISIPKDAEVGPGLRIHHFGNIFLHNQVRLGSNVTLYQGVTIGVRVPDGPVPVIEDDVSLSAYAQVLGGVRIGRGARVGALSVVLQDVPPGATAVGVPARVIDRQTAEGDPAGTPEDPQLAGSITRSASRSVG